MCELNAVDVLLLSYLKEVLLFPSLALKLVEHKPTYVSGLVGIIGVGLSPPSRLLGWVGFSASSRFPFWEGFSLSSKLMMGVTLA